MTRQSAMRACLDSYCPNSGSFGLIRPLYDIISPIWVRLHMSRHVRAHVNPCAFSTFVWVKLNWFSYLQCFLNVISLPGYHIFLGFARLWTKWPALFTTLLSVWIFSELYACVAWMLIAHGCGLSLRFRDFPDVIGFHDSSYNTSHF